MRHQPSLMGRETEVESCPVSAHRPSSSLYFSRLRSFDKKPQDTGLVWGSENGRISCHLLSKLVPPSSSNTPGFRTRGPSHPRSPGEPAPPPSCSLLPPLPTSPMGQELVPASHGLGSRSLPIPDKKGKKGSLSKMSFSGRIESQNR